MASAGLSDYTAAKDWLYSLKGGGAKYGIERMQKLSAALGFPERRYPVIHVAGTNGKGSTCAMLEAIYRTAGLKTGLFTSPHLVHLGERIQVNREILSPSAILTYTNEMSEVAARIAQADPDDHPSFFEFMTGIAFLHFAREGVDVALIETGLGGRLDSTNVVQPVASVITSISLDHTEILGNSVEAIAREKAGIVKEGVPVILGKICPAAETVIRAIACERKAPVHSITDFFGADPENYPETTLEGPYQRLNAAVASLTIDVLKERFPVAPLDVWTGLRSVRWAGRWDRYKLSDRTIIFDTSHNPEGAAQLDENLRRLKAQTGSPLTIIVGTLGRARAEALLPVVASHAAEIILVRPSQPRASSFEELESALPRDFAGRVRRSTIRELIPARGSLLAGQSGETIIATGSIYLTGELMDALFEEIPVAEHTLQDG
ncbi:MAG: bifunctional folylpolyglutamate synthase/dihydrofolate synthase [Opitutales bacterium]|nr:bifunctional folylpolyglutamate synthase/dihydrofolate synthase [Opitutales bacterium]